MESQRCEAKMKETALFRKKGYFGNVLTVNGRLVEYVYAFPAEASQENGYEHAQKVMNLEERV
jgi:hypothetical protein